MQHFIFVYLFIDTSLLSQNYFVVKKEPPSIQVLDDGSLYYFPNSEFYRDYFIYEEELLRVGVSDGVLKTFVWNHPF